MLLLQSLIVFAVVGSNIHWQWTPNPYSDIAMIYAMFGSAGAKRIRNIWGK
jgi:hypothetical protein